MSLSKSFYFGEIRNIQKEGISSHYLKTCLKPISKPQVSPASVTHPALGSGVDWRKEGRKKGKNETELCPERAPSDTLTSRCHSPPPWEWLRCAAIHCLVAVFTFVNCVPSQG